MECHVTTSERIDDLPLLVYWLKQMRVDVIVDEALGPPHGNWSGLSYGELAVVFLTHILMSCTHFLSPVQDWIAQHQASLSHALGKSVREQDGTDDRLAVLLGRLGQEKSSTGEQQANSSTGEQQANSTAGEQIERELGRHMVRAYALPTETGRIDMTSASVHHQPKDDSGLLRFGHSKDRRPDLRQFKEALGTLDPCGIPLVTATLSGEQADDPNYLPVWERMVTILGRTDFLVVGDCKLASLSNRAHIARRGGFYLTPLPLTGNTPVLLQEYLDLQYSEHIVCHTHYVGQGRPGPKRDTQVTKTCTWTVEPICRTEIIDAFNTLAGWRIYVTNTAPERLSVTDAVQSYRQEWQPEHACYGNTGDHLQYAARTVNSEWVNQNGRKMSIWSSKASEDLFARGAVKVRCRPRVTQHGGSTKTAVPGGRSG